MVKYSSPNCDAVLASLEDGGVFQMGWCAIVDKSKGFYEEYETVDTPDARRMITVAKDSIVKAKGVCSEDDLLDSIQAYAYLSASTGKPIIAWIAASALFILLNEEFFYLSADHEANGVRVTLSIPDDVFDKDDLKRVATGQPKGS